MTTSGWLFMTVSLTSVLSLVSFCLYRVLTLPPAEVEDINIAPLEIDTPDTKDPE